VYSVISEIVDSLAGNTKNRESTCLWTDRVRLFHPWAAKMSMIFCHVLRHCCCEFYRPFKRRDSWQEDQDNKKIWKTCTVPFPKDKNPLDEWRRGAVHLSSLPWLGVLARRGLAIPVTSTVHESLFSTVGNVMTKKRSRFTCDNTEELVYLHWGWPQVRDWEAVKKMRLESFFFWISKTHYPQYGKWNKEFLLLTQLFWFFIRGYEIWLT